MDKKIWYIVIGIIAVVIIAGGWIWYREAAERKVEIPEEEVIAPPITETGVVREYKVEGKPFVFSVKEMRVKAGDRVKVEFTNVEGLHDWVLDEFNARTGRLEAGEDETIEFVANKRGTFEYYCSVGNHRQMGMVGKLIVE